MTRISATSCRGTQSEPVPLDSETKTRDVWLARDRAHLIHPLHDEALTAQAPVWVRGEGARLFDVAGREYLDGLSGLWNVLAGHGNTRLVQAAADQMGTLAFAPVYAGSTHTRAIELAERLAQLCYSGIEDFFFCTSGSEATEAAIKTARFFWKTENLPQKTKILVRWGGYHGTTLAATAASGQPGYWPMFEPRVEGFVFVDPPRGIEDHAAAARLEEIIVREGSHTIAALLAEPVQVATGLQSVPADYWPRVRQICDQHQILLIADEVVTGLGRTGHWFGLEPHGIVPDMLTMAKGLTSGYVPLGAVGFQRRIAEAIRAGQGAGRWMHAGTHSAHPVAAAVALANLDLLENEGLVAQAASLAEHLKHRLAPLAAHSLVREVRTCGLLAAVELHEAPALDDAQPASAIGLAAQRAALERGLFSRARGNLFHLAPCYVTTRGQIDEMVARLAMALDDVASHNGRAPE